MLYRYSLFAVLLGLGGAVLFALTESVFAALPFVIGILCALFLARDFRRQNR
jgi:hypothetical protein